MQFSVLYLAFSFWLSCVFSHPLHAMFEQFKVQYGKLYHTQKEHNYRFAVFCNNTERIRRHNSDETQTFTMGMNKFGDRTHEEFKQTLRGFDTTVLQRSGKKLLDENDLLKKPKHFLSSAHGEQAMGTLPYETDWVMAGKVTQVKDQELCGGCWAFAVADALESRFAIAYNRMPIELSVQQQLDCNYNGVNDGCVGGNLPEGYDYIIDNKGLCLGRDYEFQGDSKKKSCRKRMRKCFTKSGQMDDYGLVVPNNERALQAAVSQGPVSIAIEADDERMQFYEDGVFTSRNCGVQVDHAMTIVGYGVDRDSGLKYWKIKGTWSDSWGEDGYIRVCRECGRNGRTGICGVTVEAVFPVICTHSKNPNCCEPTKGFWINGECCPHEKIVNGQCQQGGLHRAVV